MLCFGLNVNVLKNGCLLEHISLCVCVCVRVLTTNQRHTQKCTDKKRDRNTTKVTGQDFITHSLHINYV